VQLPKSSIPSILLHPTSFHADTHFTRRETFLSTILNYHECLKTSRVTDPIMTTRSSPASSSHVAIDKEKHSHGVPVEEKAASPMAGLSEQEREIIQRQIDAPKVTVGYFALFRYANWAELAIMFVAVIASIVAGAVMPLMTVSFGCFLFRCWVAT
jgi:hypothetical protein